MTSRSSWVTGGSDSIGRMGNGMPLAGTPTDGIGVEQVVVAGGFEHRRIVDERPEALVVVGMRDRTPGSDHVELAERVFTELG